jgi:hypothetical protein
MKKIKVLVDNRGEIHVEMDGFEGKTCHAEAERLFRKLAENGVHVKVLNQTDKDGCPVMEFGVVKA